jgi:hypothetical protein
MPQSMLAARSTGREVCPGVGGDAVGLLPQLVDAPLACFAVLCNVASSGRMRPPWPYSAVGGQTAAATPCGHLFFREIERFLHY